MASKSTSMYNPPTKPLRPFEADYPFGALADDAGRLTRTIDGDPITARWVVGRRMVGGEDQAFAPAQYDALSEAATGTRPQAVAGREIGGDAGRVVRTIDRRSGAVDYDILINSGQRPEQAIKATAHELGHVIDEITGQIPHRGLSDQLSRVYNDLNQQDWRFAKQERTGETVAPKYRAKPEDFGYKGNDVPREYIVEAIRAYLADPNYLKTVAPDVAKVIREYVNPNPGLKDILQFNSLVGLGALPAFGAIAPNKLSPKESSAFQRGDL